MNNIFTSEKFRVCGNLIFGDSLIQKILILIIISFIKNSTFNKRLYLQHNWTAYTRCFWTQGIVIFFIFEIKQANKLNKKVILVNKIGIISS